MVLKTLNALYERLLKGEAPSLVEGIPITIVFDPDIPQVTVYDDVGKIYNQTDKDWRPGEQLHIQGWYTGRISPDNSQHILLDINIGVRRNKQP